MNAFTPFYVKEVNDYSNSPVRHLVVGMIAHSEQCSHDYEPTVKFLTVQVDSPGCSIEVRERNQVKFDGLVENCVMCGAPKAKEEE